MICWFLSLFNITIDDISVIFVTLNKCVGMGNDAMDRKCSTRQYKSVRMLPFVNILRNIQQKQKYRGMFETQKSGNKTSSGEIGLNIRTLASPKVGQDQMSGGVSVPCFQFILFKFLGFYVIY